MGIHPDLSLAHSLICAVSITGSLDYRSSKTGIFCGRKHEQLHGLSHGCQLACIYDSRARILSSIVVGAEKETLGLARLA
jgi:hypothetical protein